MWICTKCETFNEETSLVCCVCGNRRENTDAKCDTTVLESNFKSSMQDADPNSSKKHDHVRMTKPDRETYKIKEGQDSADIPKELRKDTPAVSEEAPAPSQPPQPEQLQKPQVQNGDISLMPEPQPFSDNFENPFGAKAPAAAVPVQPQEAPTAAGKKSSGLLPLFIIGAMVAVAAIAAVIILLNQ